MWKACACICRFVSKIHSRKTVLEFKELLSNPAVLSVGGWRREMKLDPAKLFIWPQDIVSDAPANRYNVDVFIDIVATDKWSLHIVAIFIQAEYFLIFFLHFSSFIYIWHCPACANMTAAQWAISIVNPLGRILLVLSITVRICFLRCSVLRLDAGAEALLPGLQESGCLTELGGVSRGSSSRCWVQKSAGRWSVHWCTM